ncbi:MAG TPA: hypothetical protein VLT59_09075, partial [Steroidobacteraceae bacterium]|nr:hypothetical protein [Steroidobacteraceae bacterium]
EAGVARVAISIPGDGPIPSRLEFTTDPDRHSKFEGDGEVAAEGRKLIWSPPDDGGALRYEFALDNVRRSGMYDSRITKDWAIFRGDRMVPPVSVTSPRNAVAVATLAFDLPKDWSIVTQYAPDDQGRMRVEDPDRRFDRPEGWMLAGRIGTRREMITGIETIVAAPVEEGARRQDTLAFLMWNLPYLAEVFTEFPRRLLIVRAGDPMFRGGLSGPASLFLHLDRPLISENRTSTLLHELVHVATGLRGDKESDWIVEGLAEYYSVEILRRSGGISQLRFEEAMDRLARWGRKSKTLFKKRSSGATTARAVGVFAEVDREIRQITDDARSLDDVAALLARDRGEVSLERLQTAAAEVAGRPLEALERDRLARSEPASSD